MNTPESYYEIGKNGKWEEIIHMMDNDPVRDVCKFVKPTSGWTLLHQAAFWNRLDVCELLIEKGSDFTIKSHDEKMPVDIARDRGHFALVDALSQFVPRSPEVDPNNGHKTIGVSLLRVPYGGRIINLGPGSTYYVDKNGHVLVGWHGSVNPPHGM